MFCPQLNCGQNAIYTMNLEDLLLKNIGRLPPRLVAWIEQRLKHIPSISRKIE